MQKPASFNLILSFLVVDIALFIQTFGFYVGGVDDTIQTLCLFILYVENLKTRTILHIENIVESVKLQRINKNSMEINDVIADL